LMVSGRLTYKRSRACVRQFHALKNSVAYPRNGRRSILEKTGGGLNEIHYDPD
jgi:hypothetical protein